MSESPHAQDQYLVRLPLYVDEQIKAVSIEVGALPWGSPSYLGLLGHGATSEVADQLRIAYEWPVSWVQSRESIPQGALEFLHVHRFRGDHVLALGEQPFWNVEAGDDPPDIVADCSVGRVGIECTRLALPERQQAHGLFRVLKQRLGVVQPESLSALAGNMVYVWFKDGEEPSLPFGRPEEEAADTFIQALVNYRPDPNATRFKDTAFPNPLPPLPLHQTPDGAAFYCAPMLNAVPDTPLFNLLGFEIGLAYTSAHNVATEWNAVLSTILRKDKPGNDWLLISAGAPDNRGTIYQAEEALARLLLAHPAPPMQLEHLKRVTIHLWGSGLAVDLYPTRTDLFGPLYQGLVIPSKPFASQG